MNMKRDIETVCVHAGVEPDANFGAVMTPIYQTSTYARAQPGHPKAWGYVRGGNPTRHALEQSFAALEGAKHGLAWSSGLAATQAVVQLLEPGSHVLVSEDGYGGTGRLFRQLYSRYGISFDFVDFRNTEHVVALIQDRTRLVWMESPTNPLLRIADIRTIASAARQVGAISVVDNTFASPVFQNPLEQGADIVMHSTTKYISGYSDLIGGALMLNRDDLAERLRFIQFAAGSINSPFESFLILRGIKTLAIRMRKHFENAVEVAQALEKMEGLKEVIYPGLRPPPQHELARSQMTGFSGVIAIRIDGSGQRTSEFLKRLKVFTLAESLGGVESLVNHPLSMTHASVPEELRRHLGISSGLVRLSVGIEGTSALIDDLRWALR